MGLFKDVNVDDPVAVALKLREVLPKRPNITTIIDRMEKCAEKRVPKSIYRPVCMLVLNIRSNVSRFL